MTGIDNSRRCFLKGCSALILVGACPDLIAAPARQRGHEVIWGGLGFNRPEANVNAEFPYLNAAINNIGGFATVVDKLVSQLRSNYTQGKGVIYDRFGTIKLNDVEGALIFLVAFDDEYINIIPSGFAEDNEEHVTFYLFAQAQVLYLKGPDNSGEGSEIRTLYNFPFRVSHAGASKKGNNDYRVKMASDTLLFESNSLINTFGNELAGKVFNESITPSSIQVDSVSISDVARQKLSELGIENVLDDTFWGQTFTSSLAMEAGISVVPFRANDALGVNGLASRFDQSSKILEMASKLAGEHANRDYSVNLTIHKILRKSNGSSSVNVLYSRGMSVFIEVENNSTKEKVFNKKIFLIESHELPKHNFSLLGSFDEKYMIQIAIKLFDTFARGVITEDGELLKSVGLKNDGDIADVVALKSILLKCRI